MRCILFDMDGTLINSEAKYYAIWDQLLADNGYHLTVDFLSSYSRHAHERYSANFHGPLWDRLSV